MAATQVLIDILLDLYMKYICECKREFKSSQSLIAHFSWCKIHGNGRITPNKGKISPLKGKTYDEIYGKGDAKILKEKLRLANLNNPKITGKPKTVEGELAWKKKLSLARIKYLESSPHVDWYSVNGVKVQGKWEKNVGLKLVKDKILFSRKRIKYDTHRIYTPDFYLQELDIYLEVKGWLSDRDKNKYKKVFESNPSLLIKIIHGKREYENFVNGTIPIPDLKNLKDVI